MNEFSISLTDKFEITDDEKFSSGKIIIGEFSEDFQASMSYWNRDKYVFQWKQALRRIIGDAKTTALITSMYDPQLANFIFWWILYRDGEDVYVQNHVLFMDDIDDSFDEKCIYDYIPLRETVNEDGDNISEWTTNLKVIKAFLNSF